MPEKMVTTLNVSAYGERVETHLTLYLDTEEEKREWRADPEKYRKYRKMIETELNQRYKTVLRDTAESQQANKVRLPLTGMSMVF